MTCIIGLVHEGKVYIGADRATVDGWRNHIRAHSKVFRNGEFLIGTCGSHRVAQIIEYEFKMSVNQGIDESDIHFLVSDFADEIRTLLASRNVLTKNEDNEDKFDGGLLFGYRGGLYRLSNNFQVDHFERPFDAIGSGAPFALGAMEVLLNSSHVDTPELLIKKALMTAEVLCCDVAAPFDIEILG